MSQVFTQVLVSTFEVVAQMHGRNAALEQGRMQLRALETQLDHRQEVAGLQAGLARELIHALIERRVEAIQAGCAAVLSSYGEQARHYMQQQERFVEASFQVTDPFVKAGYLDRLSEIDGKLSAIRAESRLLYEEMNAALLTIGMPMPIVGTEDQHALMLS